MASISAEITRRRQLAVNFAVSAGQRTLAFFRQPELLVERKGDQSPVTLADRDAETHLREHILADFPRDGVLGEEFGEQAGDSGFRWILDPIDGTKSFISGVPLYGTLVAVEHEGQNVVGVIYIPALKEGVYAESGQGAWLVEGGGEPRRATVATSQQLGDGLLVTSELEGWARRGVLDKLVQLQQAAWFARTWGDCYGYVLVATGRALAMIDPCMNLWDAAAVQPIIREAGGTFTDWQGTETTAARGSRPTVEF